METEDIQYMCRAIELAGKGRGWVNPNPLVGAVIVKNGKVISEGWHERFGELHAERNAFRDCRENLAGATLYVTLEPCCHYGKTPPCTEAIIENKIARVVVGMTDPNPLIAGKGIQLLKDAGIEVVAGIEEACIREQNRIFLKYMTAKMPWVVMKTAMTLDGKIAAYTGDSRWVTGAEARLKVQDMRRTYMAIMVGSGTVKADDPMLNCRLEEKVRQPIRILVDSRAEIALQSRIVQTAGEYQTIVAHTHRAESGKLQELESRSVKTLLCKEEEGRVDVSDLLVQLAAMGIDSVLLEGGGQLNETFLRHSLVDEVYAFIAPKLIGGKETKTPVEGVGFARMEDAVLLQEVSVETVGEDILIRGMIKKDLV